MRRKVKIRAEAGIQSRQLGGAFAFYEGSRPYRWRKMGKQILMMPPGRSSWKHPWYTALRWYQEGEGLKNNKGEVIEGFGASVNPGLVNGIDPVAFGAWGDIANVADVPSQGVYRRAPGLLDSPIVPLPARAFTLVQRRMPEGYPKVTIPLGLKELGAVEYVDDISVAGANAMGGANTTFLLNTAQDPKLVKYCAVTWLYLRAARPSVIPKGEVDMSNAFFDGVKYNSKFSMENLSQWGNRAQLMVGVPPINPPPKQGPFDQPADLGFDFLPIVEIFLLSGQEPRIGENGKPVIDGGWIPFVRHHCFWNLEYRFDASHLGEIARVDRLQSGNPAFALVGIIGRYTIAPIATGAALASLSNAAMAASIRSIQGRWWT